MPSKWAVRKSMPSRSWHSVGPGGRLEVQRRHAGKVAYMASRPAAVVGDAGVGVLGGRLGGGTGSEDSHSRSERIWGSAATQLAERRRPGAGQTDDEQRGLDDLVVDGRVPAVDVLDAEAVGQEHAAGAGRGSPRPAR